MKVVVQNGSNHCLSRAELESMTRLFPESWDSAVNQLLLAQGKDLATSFHRKERVLCLYCPPSPSDSRDKARAVMCLLQGFASITGRDLPDGLEARCVSQLKTSV